MEELIAQVLENPAVSAFGTAVVVAAVALWVAAAWWAHGDAARRAESTLAGYLAAGWVILSTPLLLPLSLAVYAFARPQVVAADRRVKTLIEELTATATEQRCPACGFETEDAWLRCPSCANWLAAPCAACSRWSDIALELCPWCGEESRERPFVPDLAPVPVFATAGMPALTPGRPSHPEHLRHGAGPAGLDDADLDGRAAATNDPAADMPMTPQRRPRMAWRTLAPSVPLSQRGDDRRQTTPDSRRLGRTLRRV